MPLSNVRYRVKTTPKGEKIRLAFTKGTDKVVEAKNLRTGATHNTRPGQRPAVPGEKLKDALTRKRRSYG